jgi:hypothetical protein
MTFKPLTRRKDIVVQELKDEVLVYDLKVSKAFCLNDTSALVWKMCEGKNTVSEISNKMSSQLETLVSEDLIWLALDQFRKDGLLENGEEIEDHFAGMSRREMIRRVGMASLIALPIISSIVAPTAASAQSMAAPACTSVCFPGSVGFPGNNACAGCNAPANFIRWSSTNGSCSGGVVNVLNNFNCNGNTLTSGDDLQRN